MNRSTAMLLCTVLLCPAASPAANGTASEKPPATRTLTGKERLGPKWTDEQRIDNCNVPIDKRGSRPRSSACPHIPSG